MDRSIWLVLALAVVLVSCGREHDSALVDSRPTQSSHELPQDGGEPYVCETTVLRVYSDVSLAGFFDRYYLKDCDCIEDSVGPLDGHYKVSLVKRCDTDELITRDCYEKQSGSWVSTPCTRLKPNWPTCSVCSQF